MIRHMKVPSPASWLLAVTALSSVACASAPAAPFDTLKNANAQAYRLQNFEPPPAVPGAAVPAPGAPIPGVPPEIMTWIQQGAQALPQLIPPGLLPPGLVPGTTPAAPAPATQATPRFHTFRILAQTQVIDPELREQLGEILGNADSYDNQFARCAPGVIYPEMGLSFNSPGTQQNDLLISFSCSQVVSRSFAWPHPATGMKPDTVGKLTEVVQKLWPQGT
jgi:hypothetical protein